MSSGLGLVTVAPRVSEETDPCSASSATDVTSKLARGRDSGAEFGRSVLSSPTLFRCVVGRASSKRCKPVKQLDCHFDLLLARFSQVCGSMCWPLCCLCNATVDSHEPTKPGAR